ncbi:hypothetical protein [Leptospira stimsonii]|uniref:Uncharacterized protein n=1 Tax=Leptospira stimsonii TaxID=2202203 RepID=A0A8B3CKS6_9LEPT|nr:hypothetical protein [Leptospira stimsonii]RHX83225.1 hypothetical protein DLM78_22215 [Leptospira stimsonii]
MAEESLNIKVKATPDFKSVEKEYDRIAKKGKKGIPVSGRGKVPEKKGSSSGSGEKNSEKKKLEAASRYTGGSAMASKVGADGSDLDETQSGGFFNTLDKKISAARELFRKKKKRKDGEEDESLSNSNGIGLSSSKQLQLQKAEIKIQHANFDKGGLSGHPGSGGGGGSGGDGGSVRGNNFSLMGAAIPIAGAAFAIAGGVLKTISAIGEQYHAAMQSQASTIGATGGYVGGGGGYFANSELAQANVMGGRVTGENIYGKGNNIDSQTMRFAASQGKGIAEVVKELETIRKDSKNADVGFLRGGASASGFQGLRQSEYISKLTTISENLRGKGYSGDINDYAKFSAGLQRTDGIKMDPSRRMALSEQLSDQGISGAFGGGVFGSLSMAEALKANGGDVIKAIKESELNPGKYMSSAMGGIDGTTRGLIHKMQGGSFSEMAGMKFGYNDIKSDNSNINAGFNKGLSLDNAKKETFATDVGAQAAQIGYDMNKAMIDLFNENKGAMKSLASTVSNIEKSVIPVISGQITSLVGTIEKLAKGDFSGALGDMMGGLGKLATLANPAGLLVRSK